MSIKTVDISHEWDKKDAEIISEIVYDKLTDLVNENQKDEDIYIPTFSYTLTVHYEEEKVKWKEIIH